MATKWVRSNDVIWEELGCEALLIDCAANSAWVLNRTASHIWKYCDRIGIERLAVEFARAGNRRLSDVEMDVRNFIEALRGRGLFHCAGDLGALECLQSDTMFYGEYVAPAFTLRSLGTGPHRRPSPRGNSGPG